jgi:NDP-sugar pyrophosphorylase family protein
MKAVILAGGLGTRLKPFTQVIPKPLLPVGESSVLEIQLLTLKKAGVTDVFIATNYLSDFVTAYIGDGSKFGLNVKFSKEDKPLGTCGPVGLLRDVLTEPFFLMNGDVLTTLDFRKFYEHGMALDSDLVVATTEIATPFEFGKVTTENGYIVKLEEKPNFRIEILAGIYFLKPGIFELIPQDEYFGIDSLIKNMIAGNQKIGKYLMQEYWLDIGQVHHYEAAQEAYKDHFGHLKSGA